MEKHRFYGAFDEMYLSATNKRNTLLDIIDGWVETQGEMMFDCQKNLYGIKLKLEEPVETEVGVFHRIYLSYEFHSKRSNTHCLYFWGEHRSQCHSEDEVENKVLEVICRELGLITPEALEKSNEMTLA